MGYIHVEIRSSQVPKKTNRPCGDVVSYDRNASSTTIIVSDGLGSGIKANIAAHMCVSRISNLLKSGYSLRKTFASLVSTMNDAIENDLPYAVFTVVRILNDGVATILSYEMPPPIFVTKRYANVMPQRTITMENTLIGEANCHLEPGEGIIVFSDGISQAGLGRGYASGWGSENAAAFITDILSSGLKLNNIPGAIISRASEIWGKSLGDDCTAVLAECRRGKVVNILTGPPTNPKDDKSVIKRFVNMDGAKVICGGTTAQIAAKSLGLEITLEENPQSLLAPPMHFISGIDLVTEGAITLNQVYHTLDDDPEVFNEESGVTQLHALLNEADRINILMGMAINPANRDISFRQKGILTRQSIIPRLAKKLEASGKLVVVEKV